MKWVRRALFLLGTAGVSLLIPPVARAQEPVIAVSPTSVTAGSAVTFTGSIAVEGDLACPPADLATLTSDGPLFPPDGFGPQLERDETGGFETRYVVPATVPPGIYRIGLRCGGGNLGVSVELEVADAAPTTTPPSGSSSPAVPPVGTDATISTSSAEVDDNDSVTWIAVVLIAGVVIGGAAWIVVLTRRRR